MKKYIVYLFTLCGILTLAACSESDGGSTPGSDSTAAVTLYELSGGDNDVDVRVVTNQQASSVYYLAELTATKEARGMTEAEYAEYVVANGTQISGFVDDEQSGGYYTDTNISGLSGYTTITAVAVNGSTWGSYSMEYYGQSWTTLATGTYYFGSIAQKRLGVDEEVETELQYEAELGQYRFKDLYGTGYHLKFSDTGVSGTYGSFGITFLSVDLQTTPFTYGGYGTVSVLDVGTYYSSDEYKYSTDYGCWMITSEGSYKYYCNIGLVLRVSAGRLGITWDAFAPD